MKKSSLNLVATIGCVALILTSMALVVTPVAFADDTCVKDCEFGPDRTCVGETCGTDEDGCWYDNGSSGGYKKCATPV